MYLDCGPEATDDADVTSGSVDCTPLALQCEVRPEPNEINQRIT